MKIGFLLNHEQIHQVAHAAPIAYALSRARPDFDVTIITGSQALADEAQRYAPRFAGHHAKFVQLSLSLPMRFANRLLRGFAPVEKVALLRAHAKYLNGFDAIVTPEKTALFLRTRFGATHPKIIHTRHGAGDRAIGFDASGAKFDFALLSGQKIADRLREVGNLPPAHTISGYPKFDAVGAFDPPTNKLFNNDRKTVLYAPHPSPHLSSWYDWGRDVLEFFYQSSEYNLIFAPHVMLFQRRLNISLDRLRAARPGTLPVRYEQCDHMLIDRGSRRSVDMTYTKAADIYLGDASSQIYEFLVRPRPCLFLDPAKRNWAGDLNFDHWRAGDVLRDISGLGDALKQVQENHETYASTQAEMFAYAFDITDEPSSERAARAIAEFVEGGR